MSHFFAYLARMKFIRRWGLMHNNYPENVQEHSQRVAMIAHTLAVIRNGIFGGQVDAAMNLRQMLQADYTPLTGFCIMLFCLIYAPCIATIAMTKQETNSWGWALFQFFGLTALAYILTFSVFQIGSRLI